MESENRDELVVLLREIADFYDNIPGSKLDAFPSVYIPTYYFQENATEWGHSEGEYKVDREKSITTLAEISKAIGGHRNKVMDDDGLRLEVTLPKSGYKLIWKVDKEVTCHKVVTGKKWVEPYTREGYFQDEVEWVCDEVVLLKHNEGGE